MQITDWNSNNYTHSNVIIADSVIVPSSLTCANLIADSIVSQLVQVPTIQAPSVITQNVNCTTLTGTDTTAVNVSASGTTTVNGSINITTLNANQLDVVTLIGVDNFDVKNVECTTLNTDTFEVMHLTTDLLNTNTLTSTEVDMIASGSQFTAAASTGALQIGTANPDYTMSIALPIHATDVSVVTSDPTPQIVLQISNDPNQNVVNILGYNLTTSSLDNQSAFGGKAAMLSICSTQSPFRTLRFQDDGNLAIYSTTSTILWQSGTNVSDIRSKTDINPIVDALYKIEQLDGILYEYDLDKHSHLPSGRFAGLGAQQTQKVIPECVEKLGDSLHVHLERVVPLLIEGIKELRKRNQRIKDLLSRV